MQTTPNNIYAPDTRMSYGLARIGWVIVSAGRMSIPTFWVTHDIARAAYSFADDCTPEIPSKFCSNCQENERSYAEYVATLEPWEG
jgi:hypothetical protein